MQGVGLELVVSVDMSAGGGGMDSEYNNNWGADRREWNGL
jgi:hypothetical protein